MGFTKLDGGSSHSSERRLFRWLRILRSGVGSLVTYRHKVRWPLVIFESCAAIGITFFLGLAIWFAGPAIEARYFPVATKLSITRMISVPSGTQVDAANFVKLRDCEFLGISWFTRRPNGSLEQVAVVPLNLVRAKDLDMTVFTRPEGHNVVGPWLISLPLRDVIYFSFARIHHRCHSFWTTVTDFYP